MLDWIFYELITPSEGESTCLKFARKILAKVIELAEKSEDDNKLEDLMEQILMIKMSLEIILNILANKWSLSSRAFEYF